MQDEKTWIWQDDNYPHFKYDKDLLSKSLLSVSQNSGRLDGILTMLGVQKSNALKVESSINEIVTSSQIEGEVLDRQSVRSSILKKMAGRVTKKDTSTKHTDGLVAMFMDSSTNHSPLTVERLNGWHNTLFPDGYSGLYKINVAKFRKEEMSVVSCKGGREQTHYIAPPPDILDKEMDAFLAFVNTSTEEPCTKAAIAHFWFVTIHPYDDGNGRIARAITNYVLSKELGLNDGYYSISTAIVEDKKSYYDLLEHSQKLMYNKNLEITEWISWHTDMINKAIEISLQQVQIAIQKANFWDRAREYSLNTRQIKVLNKLLDAGEDGFEGGLNTKKYISIAKTSTATAKRDIADLVSKNLIEQVEGTAGRNVRYVVKGFNHSSH
ncbi:Fic family protein [Sulfurovum sp.]|uniref:Fic family protein n=1 Tax=Sulfurovum sp. TaxID=1969726 RepID=UPI0025D5E0A7|nr:Fic family protein [Sulfurovum sp.]